MSFWANKLNGTQQQQAPLPVSRELYPPFIPQRQDIMQQQTIPDPIAPYTPKARTTKGSICPGCGSDKYIGRHGDRTIACAECGYHPRFEQSGYMEPRLMDQGARATRQSGDTQTMQQGIALLNAGGGDHIHSV